MSDYVEHLRWKAEKALRKINESPDALFDPRLNREVCSSVDSDARAFGFINGRLEVGIKRGFEDSRETHQDMAWRITGEQEEARLRMSPAGRAWLNPRNGHNYISFWSRPTLAQIDQVGRHFGFYPKSTLIQISTEPDGKTYLWSEIGKHLSSIKKTFYDRADLMAKSRQIKLDAEGHLAHDKKKKPEKGVAWKSAETAHGFRTKAELHFALGEEIVSEAGEYADLMNMRIRKYPSGRSNATIFLRTAFEDDEHAQHEYAVRIVDNYFRKNSRRGDDGEVLTQKTEKPSRITPVVSRIKELDRAIRSGKENYTAILPFFKSLKKNRYTTREIREIVGQISFLDPYFNGKIHTYSKNRKFDLLDAVDMHLRSL